MTFYALIDARLVGSDLGEVVEFYASQEAAEKALRDVLADEPGWSGIVDIAEVELGSASPKLTRLPVGRVQGPSYPLVHGNTYADAGRGLLLARVPAVPTDLR
jgi:hypothetical protein